MSSLLGRSSDPPQPPEPIAGSEYIKTLHKYLTQNLPRLSPPSRRPSSPSLLQQSYTLLTLGLDPSSAPLSRNLKVPLTLGFGTPSTAPSGPTKPILLRLPPDRLLYLLLRWQSLPQGLPHVGRTDEPIPPNVSIGARGARMDMRENKGDGDVESVRSWVGSMRSVSMGSMKSGGIPGMGWFKKEEVNEDDLLIRLYSMFTVLPALLIHPPFFSDRPIAELIEAGGYTQLGGIDVRIPLDVLRNLQILELEGYDPRGLLIPVSHTLRNLTVKDVQDADDWIVELLTVSPDTSQSDMETDQPEEPSPRFPNLRHLCIHNGSLLDFPSLPLSSLTSLDLSHNLLENIPSALSSLHSLQSLNLSDNVITSLRSAPSILGNVTSLNLSRNRIDCVVGLERVLGLERIDLRNNNIDQWDEIGRLAELPVIKAIWYSGNPFAEPLRMGGMAGMSPEDVRVELGVIFMQSGKEVVFDGRPWSWNVSRKIEQVAASRGIERRRETSSTQRNHVHGHGRAATEGSKPAETYNSVRSDRSNGPTPNRLQAYPSIDRLRLNDGPARTAQNGQDGQNGHNGQNGETSQRAADVSSSSSHQVQNETASPASSRFTVASTSNQAPQGVQRKKKPRRVINLDTDNSTSSGPGTKDGSGGGSSARTIGGSLRLPPKIVVESTEEDEEPVKSDLPIRTGGEVTGGNAAESGKVEKDDDIPIKGQGAAIKVKKKERRKVSSSMFETSATSTRTTNG